MKHSFLLISFAIILAAFLSCCSNTDSEPSDTPGQALILDMSHNSWHMLRSFVAALGQPESTEIVREKYPCITGTCEKKTFKAGSIVAYFQDDIVQHCTITDTTVAFKRALLQRLGIKPYAPDISGNGVLRWYDVKGFEISAHQHPSGHLDYLTIRLISKSERDAKGRKKKVEAQFSAWDGSHTNLVGLIKKTMNDPGSYEHVETKFRDDGEYIMVYTKFRGKNAFGAKIIDEVAAKVDINGQVIEILQ